MAEVFTPATGNFKTEYQKLNLETETAFYASAICGFPLQPCRPCFRIQRTTLRLL
jgi:hypothetical protein